MVLSIEHGECLTHACDLLIVNQWKGTKGLKGVSATIDKALGGLLSTSMKEDSFEGSFGERCVVHTYGTIPAKRVCVLGMGSQKEFDADALRKFGGHVVKIAKDLKVKTVSTVLHGAEEARIDTRFAAEALGEGILLGSYEFRLHFGTGTNKKKHHRVEGVTIIESDGRLMKMISEGLERAHVVANGTNVARDLVNTSPRHMKPFDLVEAARSIVKRGNRITCKISNREQMEQLGMGAALAVAEGSAHPPSFIHLVYKPKKRSKKRIVVIGKGVTFDSGGLSLKPAESMTNMKIDMGGAASVLGLFTSLAELDLAVEVHGLIIAVENMPSGGAYRPGDVVQAMNGMTIEILNTDAEGRVTLADAISYAVEKIQPDELVDLATLTGSAIIALGDEYSALMSNRPALATALLTAAKDAGELVWQLPLPKQYDDALKSKVADMNNLGGKSAGCIKAGLFLQRFVDDVPWAHIDIAGPVFCERETRPDIPYGGTGVGVRTLLKYLEQRS